MRVTCRPSIPGIMMFLRIRWVFSSMAFSTPSLPKFFQAEPYRELYNRRIGGRNPPLSAGPA